MIVIKVGGSLFDHPHLFPGLKKFLGELNSDEAPFLLVPGGGRMADEVRHWHHLHGLSQDQAHWLALQTLSISARLLATLSDDIPIVFHPLQTVDSSAPICILDAFEYCQRDDTLAHSWSVTSDSVAVHVAQTAQAGQLILLKSVDFPGQTSWEQAAANGWVDDHFPAAMAGSKLHVTVVNFRGFLSQFFCN